jgi:hypothetical protein
MAPSLGGGMRNLLYSPGNARKSTSFAVGLAIAMLAATAAAQTQYPKNEIFGGYAALFPNGWQELEYKSNTIPNAFDVSNTYYFCRFCNLGWVLDGSGHFRGGTTPPNLDNGSTDSTGVGYALTGLQYKWHSERFSPFARMLIGAANISPDCCHGTKWRFAIGGGGGLDWKLSHRVSYRMIQADYIYSSYPHIFPSNHSEGWNSVRLATGLVFSLGTAAGCNLAPTACVVTAASPTEVLAGEPVKFSTSGSNFNPKDSLTYGWKSSGGKLSSSDGAATTIDTTGLAAGTYTATATVQDAKRKGSVATCSATFLVKAPPAPMPPTLACAATPAEVDAGRASIITLTVTNPDARPLTYDWSASSGQLSPNGASATLTPSNNDAATSITVTGKVTDDRGLTASCSSIVRVHALPPPCVNPEPWGQCTFVQNPYLPARVDNDCKDILDKLALDMQGKPAGQLVIVGSAADPAKLASLGAQRAANAKYYLTTSGATTIDGDRIVTRQGGSGDDVVRFYFVPAGDLCAGHPELGTAVDESTVKGQARGKLPAHKKKKAEGAQ